MSVGENETHHPRTTLHIYSTVQQAKRHVVPQGLAKTTTSGLVLFSVAFVEREGQAQTSVHAVDSLKAPLIPRNGVDFPAK